MLCFIQVVPLLPCLRNTSLTQAPFVCTLGGLGLGFRSFKCLDLIEDSRGGK